MKSKMKIIIAFFVVALVLVGVVVVSLTSDTKKINEKINSSNVLSAGSTDNDIYSNEYTLMLENEYLQFWINGDTTEFKVVNKQNNSEWYSSGSDNSSGTSPISVSYLNSQGGISDMNVMTDSVTDGKYIVKHEGDKVTVQYSIGEFSELSLVPYALTEERLQEILDNLGDEFEQMKLIDLYYLTDINIIEDPEQKKERLAEYPLLSKQKLYIIRDSARDDPLVKKDVAKIFTEAGYTEEDYNSDSKYFSANDSAKTAPGFNIKVEYTLNEKKLHICIPYDGIEMYEEFPITSLTIAPNFGSPAKGTEGWYLLPDGSGSIMNFYNGNTNGKIYMTSVYDEELTVAGRENIDSDKGASLPIFGIRRDGCGVLCEITEGDAISQIKAFSGDDTEASYVHAAFNVRSTYKTTATTGRKESYIIIQKQRYTGDIALDYHFIDSNDVTLSDMASVMRESIFGNSQKKASDTLPVRLEMVGMITRRDQFLGIAYDEKVCLTDFQQSLDIANTFLESGIKNLSVTTIGWFGEGVEHKFLSGNVSPSAVLGGKNDFRSLIEGMKEKNIPFYIDADVQYTAKTSLFDGFSKNSDTATMLDQSMGKVEKYDPASFIKINGSSRYINNAQAQKMAIDALRLTAEEYGVTGISLRTLGSQLSSDYGNPTIDRQAMADMVSKYLGELSESGYKITTQGAFAYVLPYISEATNVPVTSCGFDTTDMSVPFLQMVLSGYVDYYAPDINLSGDTQTAMLQAVSAGAGVSCTLTAQNYDKLNDSNQNNLYSTDFEYWKEKLPKRISDMQMRLASVAGERIVGYEKLAQGVYKTVYGNGIEVIVNYNAESFVSDDITVNAKDFGVKGGCS